MGCQTQEETEYCSFARMTSYVERLPLPLPFPWEFGVDRAHGLPVVLCKAGCSFFIHCVVACPFSKALVDMDEWFQTLGRYLYTLNVGSSHPFFLHADIFSNGSSWSHLRPSAGTAAETGTVGAAVPQRSFKMLRCNAHGLSYPPSSEHGGFGWPFSHVVRLPIYVLYRYMFKIQKRMSGCLLGRYLYTSNVGCRIHSICAYMLCLRSASIDWQWGCGSARESLGLSMVNDK